jgi:outer membrane protein assembly factor BamB
MKAFTHLCLGFSLISLSLPAADWSQFRGPQSSGVSADNTALPSELKPAWNAELPGRGLSCPIVVGDKVFVTAASGNEQTTLHVLCFSARTAPNSGSAPCAPLAAP